MKSFIMIIFASVFFILGGCAQESNKESLPEMVDVEIILPEVIKKGETVALKARITQGKEDVNDADSVQFEIWKEGQETHEKLDAKNTESGIYAIQKSFSEAGKYTIIAHVTARDMHNMPKMEFIVE
ncbi:FixH family protein [Mesobacillus jeotgali]|uniref:FixH family protein n=1 Tax=Mesobacillus jeotgali TaxID=129985 RepID=A0ABY9VHH1_9BACI|nr:FixH family protein [Mesobacillus jeotgali]WNF22589.1 FixH family protein [Mesobacillus jeotgali]